MEQYVDYEDTNPSKMAKLKPILSDVRIALMKVWPRMYRIINSLFYFILNLIKSIISLSIKQVKEW